MDLSTDGDMTMISALLDIGSPTVEDFTKAVEDLTKTPRNSTLASAAEESANREAVDVPVLTPVLQDLPLELDQIPISCGENWDKAVDTVLTEWSKVGSNFSRLREMFEVLGWEHKNLSAAVIRDFRMMEWRASLLDNKILLLKEHIGHHAMASEAGTKTVWNVIAKIHDKMDTAAASIWRMSEVFE